MTDKRIKPRMHRRIPLRVDLQFVGAAGPHRLVEMSEGGLSFAAPAGLGLGADLTALVTDEEASLRLPGKIVHASLRDGETVYGLQFDPLPPDTAAGVRSLLKRHRFAAFRLAHH